MLKVSWMESELAEIVLVIPMGKMMELMSRVMMSALLMETM
jgi:hypothetical protein